MAARLKSGCGVLGGFHRESETWLSTVWLLPLRGMSEARQPEVGRIVDGKYRLTRLLGHGGMGSVWEGVHTSLGTRFALKYIDVAFAGRPDVRARFANEALAAARLKSKHIVQVYDHGVDEQGAPYIVMEFLSGEPLDVKLAREKRLDLADATSLVIQIAKALHRAHAAGIVHRDLKPENVFLVWDEEDQKTLVKVVDFGIAKFVDGSGVDSATRTGAVLGTPHFMSPEQARGLKTVDRAADVWSLGVIAYRCVAGCLPFEGEAVGDLLVKICTIDHPPPSSFVEVPAGFDEWMARCLEKEPDKRFASAKEQADALKELVHKLDPSLSLAAISNQEPALDGKDQRVVARGSTGDTTDGVEGVARTVSSRRWLLPVLVGAAGVFALLVWRATRTEGTSLLPVAMSAAVDSVAAQGASPPVTAAAGSEPSLLSAAPSAPSPPAGVSGGRSALPSAPVPQALAPKAAKPPRPLRPVQRDEPPKPPPKRPAAPTDELGY